jgi:hypothetical protein
MIQWSHMSYKAVHKNKAKFIYWCNDCNQSKSPAAAGVCIMLSHHVVKFPVQQVRIIHSLLQVVGLLTLLLFFVIPVHASGLGPTINSPLGNIYVNNPSINITNRQTHTMQYFHWYVYKDGALCAYDEDNGTPAFTWGTHFAWTANCTPEQTNHIAELNVQYELRAMTGNDTDGWSEITSGAYFTYTNAPTPTNSPTPTLTPSPTPAAGMTNIPNIYYSVVLQTCSDNASYNCGYYVIHNWSDNYDVLSANLYANNWSVLIHNHTFPAPIYPNYLSSWEQFSCLKSDTCVVGQRLNPEYTEVSLTIKNEDTEATSSLQLSKVNKLSDNSPTFGSVIYGTADMATASGIATQSCTDISLFGFIVPDYFCQFRQWMFTTLSYYFIPKQSDISTQFNNLLNLTYQKAPWEYIYAVTNMDLSDPPMPSPAKIPDITIPAVVFKAQDVQHGTYTNVNVLGASTISASVWPAELSTIIGQMRTGFIGIIIGVFTVGVMSLITSAI